MRESVAGDLLHATLRYDRTVGNADVLRLVPSRFVVRRVVGNRSGTVVVGALLPEMAYRRTRLVCFVRDDVVISMYLRDLIVSLVYTAINASLVVTSAVRLNIVEVMYAVNALLVTVLVISVPDRALSGVDHDLYSGLRAFPLRLEEVLYGRK